MPFTSLKNRERNGVKGERPASQTFGQIRCPPHPLILHQLMTVDFIESTMKYFGLHLLQAGYIFLMKYLLEQAKTPVRCKLGVTHDKKVQGDGVVTS